MPLLATWVCWFLRAALVSMAMLPRFCVCAFKFNLKDVCDVEYDCTFDPSSGHPYGLAPQCIAQCFGCGGGHGLRGEPSDALKPLTRTFDQGTLEKAARAKPQASAKQAELMKMLNTTGRKLIHTPIGWVNSTEATPAPPEPDRFLDDLEDKLTVGFVGGAALFAFTAAVAVGGTYVAERRRSNQTNQPGNHADTPPNVDTAQV
jgi:hypothetical protein